MIINISEHSIETDNLTPGCWVLDFGCGVDFNFSKKMIEMGMRVISIDPNPNIIDVPDLENLFYERKALVSNDNNIEFIELDIFNDTDAASTIKTKNDIGFVSKQRTMMVETTTINKLMEKYNIEQIEIIKLDIEGAEYSVLLDIDTNIAKQLSIEFHDFRGMNPYYPNNETYYNILKERFHNYHFAKHRLEQHPGIPGSSGLNYWDSLLIRK